VYEIYRHLADWLLGKSELDVEKQYTEIGAKRARQAKTLDKRVDRLYAEARLQVKRRRRKKVPHADRQPLVRPSQPNEVWSADFVFDRTAEGRVLKCLTIVDDATTEAVATVPARALGGLAVTRILDRLAIDRGLPTALRTDNGPEFCSRAMLTWAYDRGVTLRLIEPGKPNQNAYIESFNAAFATSVSMSTGSRACPTRRPSSKPGDVSTTTNDRRRRWAG
jgi:transposase InsO family protein